MTAEQRLQEYLYAQIPISKHMGVEVRTAELDGILLFAPLAPNVNHASTAFGGSISTLATLAAFSLVQHRLSMEVAPSLLVISSHRVNYLHPIQGDFEASSEAPSDESWAAFLRALHRKGKGRVAVSACVHSDGCLCAEFDGEFVAVSPE